MLNELQILESVIYGKIDIDRKPPHLISIKWTKNGVLLMELEKFKNYVSITFWMEKYL